MIWRFCRVGAWVRGIPGQTGAEFIRVPWIEEAKKLVFTFRGKRERRRKRERKDRGGGREDGENDQLVQARSVSTQRASCTEF